MSLVRCPECRKRVSHKAKACIKCGLPFDEFSGVFSFGCLLTSLSRFILALKGYFFGYILFVAIPRNSSWETVKTLTDAFQIFKLHIFGGTISILFGAYFTFSGLRNFTSHVLIKSEDVKLSVRFRSWQLISLILTVVFLICMTVYHIDLYDNATFTNYKDGDVVFWCDARSEQYGLPIIPIKPDEYLSKKKLLAKGLNASDEELKMRGLIPELKKTINWDYVIFTTISPIVEFWILALVISGLFGMNTGIREHSQIIAWLKSNTKKQLVIASLIGCFTIAIVYLSLFFTYKLPQIRSEKRKQEITKEQETWEKQHNWREAGMIIDATDSWAPFISVMIQPGDTVRIKASGKWRIGKSWPFHGPEGSDKKTFFVYPRPLKKQKLGRLVGKIGGTLYDVGSSAEFIASESGLLEFQINDKKLKDNEGECSISVAVFRNY